MGRYRNVETRIWNDEKFRSLSHDAKLIFFFILTNPNMTALGAMRGTIPGMAAELNMSAKGFGEGFAELFRKGLVEHDETACFVGLPNFLKYNQPENPNVVKSWEKCLDVIPECKFKLLTLQRAKVCAETLGEGFAKGLPEPFRKGMPNQEQEQEQEQEHNKTPLIPFELEDKPKRKRKTKPDDQGDISVDDLPIPECLRSTQFDSAWAEWKRFRTELNKPITVTAAKSQLKLLESFGLEKALRSIANSLVGSYQGLFDPDKTPHVKSNVPQRPADFFSGIHAFVDSHGGGQ